MRSKEAIKAAQARYEQKMLRVSTRLDPERDADMIAHLKTVGSVAAYVKELIREDMERRGKA